MFDNHFNCNRHHCPLFETCDCFATAKDPHVSIVTCEHKFAEEQDIAGISYFLPVIIFTTWGVFAKMISMRLDICNSVDC